MKFTYCPECSEILTEKECGDEGLVPYCTSCNKVLFPFSYPCVICLVINEENKIALIKQSYVSDRYICVAGYIKPGETIEDTAMREVEEEIGLKVLSAEFIKSYYYEKRDSLMIGFVCRVEETDFNISGEVDSAKWFTIQEAEHLLRQGSIGKDLFNDYKQRVV